jgi:hypothetical protein
LVSALEYLANLSQNTEVLLLLHSPANMVLFSGALPQSSALAIAFAVFLGQAFAENIVTNA